MPNPPVIDSAPAISAQRRDAVDRARQRWISRLIDLSQRNNLLYFRPLKVGTLDLTPADRDALADLLSGKTVGLNKLLPQHDDRAKLTAQVKQIARTARENAEERGLETLFLAAGMATWEGEPGKRPPESAALLVPITVNSRDRSGPTLKRAGEPQVNPVLLHVLAATFNCQIQPDVLLAAADIDPERDDDPFDLDALLMKLDELGRGIPGFGVRRTVMLGNFFFQKMAMVRDLRELSDALASSDLIAGLAGDVEAQQRVSGKSGNGSAPTIDPREFDRTPPEKEFLVLDADATQQTAIAIAQSGTSTVIQGPPGTGKSQVIANLIVNAAAAGKRVLFVAEKRAALQVVLDRLDRVGLGHLALDLHGADTSRKAIAGRMRDALDYIQKGEPIVSDTMLATLVDRRNRLNAHVQRMHAPRQPSGLSVYQLQETLLRDSPAVPLKSRLRGQSLMTINPNVVSEIKDLLASAADLGPLFLATDSSPWSRAILADGHTAQAAMDLATSLADRALPDTRARINSTLGALRSAPAVNLDEAERLLELADQVDALLRAYRADLFNETLGGLVAGLQPAAKDFIPRLVATLFNGSYKRAKLTMSQYAIASKPAPLEMLKAATEASRLQRSWREAKMDSPTPVSSGDASQSLQLVRDLRSKLDRLSSQLREDLSKLSFDALGERLAALRDDSLTPRRIPKLREIEKRLDSLGLQAFVAEFRQTPSPGESWPAAFEWAWLRSCLDHALAEEPELAAFSGQVHGKHVAEFVDLDKRRLELAAKQVATRHVREAMSILGNLGQQASLVRREAEKKMRHLPFRRLVEQAPDVLATLFPCFMCSPLSVSQLLPGERRMFDVVIFDEASQVLPEDAVPSLMRATQAVVAGDQHQLPPTPFFAAGDDEAGESDRQSAPDDVDATEGFESLLSMMSVFAPSPMLQWHYRSRDERLIAFSNRHIYGGGLITFPSPAIEPSVEHVLVKSDDNTGGDDESASPEVRRVVDLILQHAEREIAKPPVQRRSLGVIALGITHARRIEAAIDQALEAREGNELDEFFDPTTPDRFFVKNLERVQGDERDTIILTMGVAPDAVGRAKLTRFGPLNNRAHGYRRLNVAITRARQRMIVVSSFSHHGIDASGSISRGMDLLRQYIQYASEGGRLNSDGGTTAVALNDFEASVAGALAAKGIVTVGQWGASGYRIDLVAQHPSQPGRFVLAIECDGATYQSAPTARDRDRLRQQHLESLGWRFHRIWSTDWFTRKEVELRRLLAAYESAVAQADNR